MKGPRHHQHEDILRDVQRAPDDIRWTIDQAEFGDLLAFKKDSAPCPDGIRYGAYRCAGGLGSHFLFNLIELAWKVLLFLSVLLKVGLFLSLRPLTSKTIEGLFDHLMHFALTL